MKALDTPLLLELLRGRPGAKRLLPHLQGEELATTELNLYELEVIARSEGGRSREQRRATLAKLRRRLTVLPIDERAVRAGLGRDSAKVGRDPPSVALMLGAAEAGGCEEWLTTPHGRPLGTGGKLAIRIIDV